MTGEAVEYLFVGGLRQDYCITHDGRVYLGVLGGNAVYAAVGARVWGCPVGIVGRVGSNFPVAWLEGLERAGIDARGVRVLDEPLNTCTFYAYHDAETRVDTNPALHFLRIGHPLPKELIDYHSSTEGQDQRDRFAPAAVRPTDLPDHNASARAAHLAPADLMTHLTVPGRLRESGVRLITMDPSVRYMVPDHGRDLPVMLHRVDAFLPSRAEAEAYFRPRTPGVWEMAEAFASMGCRFVVLKRGAQGQCLWDAEARRRWIVPAYPAQVRDVTGAGDAFCGGFLAGLDRTGEAREACLWGSVSASLVVEGSGALYALPAMPGLARARLEALRPAVTQA
jgi:ribokinase